MKKLLLGTVLLALAIVVPVPTMAGVNISIGISLPPPVAFEAPPDVVVMPDTNSVYVVPDVEADLFFWNGFWWRLWEGRWYRSYYYNRGWAYYNNVPSFYYDVDPHWREYYRDRDWHGHPWNYERIPDRRLQHNWRRWRDNRYWERRETWGVRGYQPPPQRQMLELRHQRQEQYQRRPEVQRHQQWMQEQQRQPHDSRGYQERRPQAQQLFQQQRQPQVQQAERGRAMRPQGGPIGRGDRQQFQPSENRRPMGGPALGGDRRQVKPEKKTNTAGPGRGRQSKDEGRPER